MELVFIGTGSGLPTPQRNLPSLAIRFLSDGAVWLFDCGECTQHQILRSVINSGKIEKIFISSLESDELFGLPGLLCTMGHNESPDKGHIEIFGPSGLRRYLRRTLQLSASRVAVRFQVNELDFGTGSSAPDTGRHWDEIEGFQVPSPSPGIWDVLDNGEVSVRAVKLQNPTFSICYVISEKEAPGRLDDVKCRALGVPWGPLLGQLKNGKDVTLKDGSIVRAVDVVGPPLKGRRIAVLGRTQDPSSVGGAADGADVIVCEGSVLATDGPAVPRSYRPTAASAGALAQVAQGQTLILNRFPTTFAQEEQLRTETSAAVFAASNIQDPQSRSEAMRAVYRHAHAPKDVDRVAQLIAEAQSTFSGHVLASHDFMTFLVKRSDEPDA